MSGRRAWLCSATLVALCLWAGPVAAQITTGTIAGNVKDAQGGVIPGATIVLTNEAQGTRSAPIVSSGQGDFVFPNLSPGTYSIEVTMSSFKTLKQSNIQVSPASRTSLSLTLDVGGTSETVNVRAEAPTIQAASGERSFTVETDVVQNLPISNRSFTALADLAPGVNGTNREGGGGGRNVMMDGVSTMDTGSNAILLQMNVESIAEVKVLVSTYQAEYGRSSGVQISAVTKSGTNRFRGSVYDVERNSSWNSNSKTNNLNGDPKNISKQRDWGYSIGGPVGKAGGNNKLFFFYSHEYAPRTGGNDVVRYRMPTDLERQGDFSKTYDQNGAPYPYIKDPRLSGTCSATSTAACFADGGVLGKIPANMLYQTGLNILNLYPKPNLDGAGQTYNYQLTRPSESILAWQPAVRVDYQPWQPLRATFEYSGWKQRNQTILGLIPGWNDTKMQNPIVSTYAVTVNYNLNASTFFEGTYGHSQNELAGCALAQGGTGPSFCQNALPMNDISNRLTNGLAGLPLLFPDSATIEQRYYAYRVLNNVAPPFWDGTRILKVPSFSWGNRVSNAPPGFGFPGYLNINATDDIALSATKVIGRHTMKSGFYNTHSFKAQQRGGWDGSISFSQDTVGTNQYDTSYGFANAAIGSFSSFGQASKYVEGNFVYNNTEWYVQDNWKVNRKLTFDYGVRFVHQQPQYDSYGQASNFFPDKWSQSQAPVLYVAGCVGGAYPCSGNNRQAMNPTTGQLLGPNSTLAIGTLVPNSGNQLNGLYLSGQGISKTTYTWPALGVAPRFGFAYDVSGKQSLVLRGGAGIYFDRPSGNSIYSQVQNPPTYKNITVRYGQLQTLGSGGLTTEGPPSLNVFEYAGGLPSSTQWNGGFQKLLPWATTVDVEYVGQHSWNSLEGVNLNAVDLGSAFLPQNQDPSLPASATPGATAVSTDRMRAFRGYSSISQQWGRGWATYHSIQISFNRRFQHGVSFGFNDTIALYNHTSTTARLQHNPDGTYSIRSDQAKADEMFGTDISPRHRMKANFVWDLPDLKGSGSMVRSIGLVVNDWQLSGIWAGATAATYAIGYNYSSGGGNVNLTGSSDFGARARIVGDTGRGCAADVYRQFNTSAFQGPLTNSDGLESRDGYMRGCFTNTLDLAIARNIRLPKGRTIQLRVDMFNAPNAAGITGRNTTMNLTNPTDPVTINNLAYDPVTGLLNDGVNLLPNGSLSPNRSQPKNAGFGVVNGYQGPRTVQAQIRFTF